MTRSHWCRVAAWAGLWAVCFALGFAGAWAVLAGMARRNGVSW